jgi:TRAP transporter 4TM/12TM fusion protein
LGRSGLVAKEQGSSRYRQFKGPLQKFVTGYTCSCVIYHLIYVSVILERLRIYFIDPYAHRALSLCWVTSLVFLLLPATKKSRRDRLAWYDAFLAVIVMAPAIYVFKDPEVVQYHAIMWQPIDVVMGGILIVCILEAVRRSTNWSLSFLAFISLLYFPYGQYFPGIFSRPEIPWPRAISMVMYIGDGLFGTITGVLSTIVVIFLVFGAFLMVTGASKIFMDLALALAGPMKGGPAKVAVVGSAMFGTLSGAASANVAITGSITIPMMKSMGFRPALAGGVEAFASTGGVFMPPVMGIVAFLMAEVLGVSYFSICIAAILPALLYYIAGFIMVHFESVRLGLVGLPRSECPPLWGTLRRSGGILLPFGILVYFLSIGYSAETSCIYALVALLILSMFKKETRLNWSRFAQGLTEGGRMLTLVIPLGGAAALLMCAVAFTGAAVKISDALIALSGGEVFVLLVLAAIFSLILGMGLPPMVCYIILAALVAPALVQMGILPIAAHMFIFYFGTLSFITPPICLAAYVAASIAGTSPMRTAGNAVRLGIVAVVAPFIFALHPAILLQGGSAVDIILPVLTAIVGTTFLASGVAGHFIREMKWLERVLLIASGLLLMIPGWATDIAGASLGVLICLLNWRAPGRRRLSRQLFTGGSRDKS